MLIGAGVSFGLVPPLHCKGRQPRIRVCRGEDRDGEKGDEDEEGRLEVVTRLCAEQGRAGSNAFPGNRDWILFGNREMGSTLYTYN